MPKITQWANGSLKHLCNWTSRHYVPTRMLFFCNHSTIFSIYYNSDVFRQTQYWWKTSLTWISCFHQILNTIWNHKANSWNPSNLLFIFFPIESDISKESMIELFLYTAKAIFHTMLLWTKVDKFLHFDVLFEGRKKKVFSFKQCIWVMETC